MQKHFIPDLERIASISKGISTIENLSGHCHYLKSLLADTELTEADVYDQYFDQENDDLLDETQKTIFSLRAVWLYEVNLMKGQMKPEIPDSKDEFIKKYLKPGVKPQEGDIAAFLHTYYNSEIDVPKGIPEYIRLMDYKDFLTTFYWQAVSCQARSEHDRCQLCGSKKDLQVHHPHYDFHGDEIRNIGNLTVLCHDCHAKFHGKKK